MANAMYVGKIFKNMTGLYLLSQIYYGDAKLYNLCDMIRYYPVFYL